MKNPREDIPVPISERAYPLEQWDDEVNPLIGTRYQIVPQPEEWKKTDWSFLQDTQTGKVFRYRFQRQAATAASITGPLKAPGVTWVNCLEFKT